MRTSGSVQQTLRTLLNTSRSVCKEAVCRRGLNTLNSSAFAEHLLQMLCFKCCNDFSVILYLHEKQALLGNGIAETLGRLPKCCWTSCSKELCLQTSNVTDCNSWTSCSKVWGLIIHSLINCNYRNVATLATGILYIFKTVWNFWKVAQPVSQFQEDLVTSIGVLWLSWWMFEIVYFG